MKFFFDIVLNPFKEIKVFIQAFYSLSDIYVKVDKWVLSVFHTKFT